MWKAEVCDTGRRGTAVLGILDIADREETALVCKDGDVRIDWREAVVRLRHLAALLEIIFDIATISTQGLILDGRFTRRNGRLHNSIGTEAKLARSGDDVAMQLIFSAYRRSQSGLLLASVIIWGRRGYGAWLDN